MKTRHGFVSNSSSSSFIIGVKGKLTKEKLMRSFKVDKESPLFSIAKEITKVMLNSEEFSLKELLKDRECSIDELSDIERKIFDNGFKLYIGQASNDGYGSAGAETVLCNMDLDYEDEDLILFKEGGY